MTNNSSVVIFPSIFAKNKLNDLFSNIKKILVLQNQNFTKISKDDSIIIVEANDPVFCSSAINLLFGIERIAIAKQIENEFDSLVSAITKIGLNLLLKGDRFFVKVEGYSKGYVPKDIEMAATSSLIEKSTKLGAKPGTVDNHDKLFYTYLTSSKGYVCIFSDKGNGGVPNNSQKERVVCCIFDELSAVSCLETIRQGFDIKIILCHRTYPELINLVKILNNIIPRLLCSKIELEIFKITLKGNNVKNYLILIEVITEIMSSVALTNNIKRISLPLSPLIFSQQFIDNISKKVYQKKLNLHSPMVGIDENIFELAREIGLKKYLPKIEKIISMKFNASIKTNNNLLKIVKEALKAKKVVVTKVGSNNVHDILDSLEINH